MKSLNFKHLFWIRKSRMKENKAPLYLRVMLNGERKEINLNHYLDPSIWDGEAHRPVGRSPEARITNQVIFKAQDKIEQILFEHESENKYLSLQIFQRMFAEEEAEEETLLGFVDYHEKKLKDTLSQGTLKNYKTTKKYLAEFLIKKRRCNNVYLHQVNYKFCIEFESFLRAKETLTNNGVMKHIERFKKLMNFAHTLELIDKNPIEKFKLKFNKVEVAYLNKEELSTIEKAVFQEPKHIINRDIFVFSCYTGMSYADVKKLTPDDIHIGIDGNSWIYFNRQKTDIRVRVPLLPKAIEILEKYKEHPASAQRGKLLPVYSNQKTNKYLKEVAKIAKIREDISFHTARHTFATTVTLSNGISIETVSKLLGHTKLSTTQIYARVLDTKIADEMASLQTKFTHQSDNQEFKEAK